MKKQLIILGTGFCVLVCFLIIMGVTGITIYLAVTHPIAGFIGFVLVMSFLLGKLLFGEELR